MQKIQNGQKSAVGQILSRTVIGHSRADAALGCQHHLLSQGWCLGKHLSELSDDVLQRAAAGAVADASPIDDIRTSAAYRRHVTGVLVRRALVAATAGFAQEADR